MITFLGMLFQNWRKLIATVLTVTGAIWLPLEAYIVLEDNINLRGYFGIFIIMSILIGAIVFVLDGVFLRKFLKNKIEIKSDLTGKKVTVKFGDLFSEVGHKAIGVNDCFDHVVNHQIISPNTNRRGL